MSPAGPGLALVEAAVGHQHRPASKRSGHHSAGQTRPVASKDVVPDRMAPVNALLDVAPPRLREALLVAFLDRLTR